MNRPLGSARPLPSRPWLVTLTGLGVFVLYAVTTARDRVVNDVLSASLAAWRIGTTGQPWFDGFPLDEIPTGPNQELWTGVAGNGHVAVFRSPGAIVVGVPGYALRQGGTDPSDFSLLPGALTAALLATVTLFLFWLVLRLHMSDGVAALMVLTLGLTTPMWTVNANSLWTHSLTVIGIAGMSWATTRERWWLVGVFGGLALWGRLHMALVVAILGLGLALWRRRPRIALEVGATSASFMALAAAWSRWMYGEWSPQGPYPSGPAYAGAAADTSLTDHLVNQLGLWVSPDRGILVWTPLLVVLLPTVFRSWRSLPDWTRVLSMAGIAYTLVQGFLNLFPGGSGFYGYRLTLELLACLFPAFAIAATRMRSWEWWVAAPVIGLQLGAISFGAFAEGYFLRVDESWTDNSLALALRTFPIPVAAWLVLCLALVLLAARLVGQHTRATREPAPADS